MRPKEEPFEGERADLKGAVFDLTENKSYFAETCRKISVYVGRNLKDAMDYRLALQGRDMPAIEAPQRPPFGAPDEDFKEYEERRKRYWDRLDKRRIRGGQVYSLLCGQCSPTLMSNTS